MKVTLETILEEKDKGVYDGDLIKYQNKYGNTDELKESYLNHFE